MIKWMKQIDCPFDCNRTWFTVFRPLIDRLLVNDIRCGTPAVCCWPLPPRPLKSWPPIYFSCDSFYWPVDSSVAQSLDVLFWMKKRKVHAEEKIPQKVIDLFYNKYVRIIQIMECRPWLIGEIWVWQRCPIIYKDSGGKWQLGCQIFRRIGITD